MMTHWRTQKFNKRGLKIESYRVKIRDCLTLKNFIIMGILKKSLVKDELTLKSFLQK